MISLKRQICQDIYDSLFPIVALCIALLMVGCGGQFTGGGNPIPDTPKGQYVTARTFYNDQLESLTIYGQVLTLEEKQEMKKELDPVLDGLETTLNGWQLALMDPSKDPTAYNSAFTKLRGQMVVIIMKYMRE